MIVLKVIAEGLGLGLIICLYCAIGIRKGAAGLVHLYSTEVQERVVKLGVMTEKEIKKTSKDSESGKCIHVSDLCACLRMHDQWRQRICM